MSAPEGLPRLVTAPVSGWCDPETGECHIDTAEEPATPAAGDQNALGGQSPSGGQSPPEDRPEAAAG
ncbi:hypothetical protein [Ruania albidiflava]|uniref:hypothetical protein n=1 Tax=Ruania albidiflava TaxID=366586 RepID=UPI0003B69C27|nr:hypothetical protein [Ruania albidiflava]